MIKYFTAILITILCASLVDAQSTFAWSLETDQIGQDWIGTYKMYKIDPFAGSHELFFDIPSDRFEHDDMTGLQFQIVSFVFTKDREQIYFVARDGDLYVYSIADDNLTYLEDLTPKDGDFQVHNIQQINCISWIDDTTLYATGQTYITYNITDSTKEVIRETTDFPTSFTDFERDIATRVFFKHKNQNIYLSNTSKIQKQLDLYDPEEVMTLADFSAETIAGAFNPIISYQYSCDSIALYMLSSISEVNVFRVDIQNEVLVPIVSYPLYDDIIFIIDVEHFNEPDYDVCLRAIDLDEDDSSGAIGADYQSDTLCIHTDIAIADEDVIVTNDVPIDSLTLRIVSPKAAQYLSIPMGNYMLSENNTANVSVKQNGSTALIDYANAVSAARYMDDASYRSGEVIIEVLVWQGGIAGATASSYLYISDRDEVVEYIVLDYCQQDGLVLIDDDISYSGSIYEMGELVSPLMLDLSIAEENLYSFVSDGYCPDTALVLVVVHSILESVEISDTIMCHDDILQVDIPLEINSQIVWNNDSQEPTIEIYEAGEYHYTISDVYGCEASDTFIVEYSAEPSIMPVSVFVCEGETSPYYDLLLDTPGEYEYIEMSVQSCDSIIHQIEFDFYPLDPIQYVNEIAFCEGDSVELEVSSSHIDITYNGAELVGNTHISNDMPLNITAIDSYGCEVLDTIYPMIFTNPQVYVNDIIDKDATEGIPIEVDYVGDIVEYMWSPLTSLDCSECPYPTVTGEVDQLYTINVTSVDGCIAQASLNVSTTIAEYFLPNVIAKEARTEINRSFYLISNIDVRYDVQIYDRWGGQITALKNLEANDPSVGWMPNRYNITKGVYVYQVHIYNGDAVKVLVGDITIL